MLAKTFAGILLGLPLSLVIISLAIFIWPGSSEAVVLPFFVAFFPLWVAVMAITYLCRSAWRAWAWLAVANVAAFAALFAAKQLLPGL